MGGSATPSDSTKQNEIQMINIATRGNATDFGDLTAARNNGYSCSNGHGGLDAESQRAPELYSPTGKVLPAGLGVGDIGLFLGGEYNYTTICDFIQISTLGNAVDFGDIISARSTGGGGGSSTRYVVGGGQPYDDTIQYGSFSTKGNTADFGNLTDARDLIKAVNNETRMVWGGGRDAPSSYSNILDYITIATIGNATDFGDLTTATWRIGGNVNSSTRGLFFGGTTPSYINTIEYITIGSTGNATDFGDLTTTRGNSGGVSSTTRGVFAGGQNPGQTDVIDYVTIASTGNATDFGDLDIATSYASGVNNNVRGVYGGFLNPSAPGADPSFGNAPQISYITIASTGNAASFGELTSRRYGVVSACNGHGGLS
jgi:hypothetical protein